MTSHWLMGIQYLDSYTVDQTTPPPTSPTMAQMFHSVSDRGKHQTNISQNSNFIYAECLYMLNVHNAECLLMFNAYIECLMFRNSSHSAVGKRVGLGNFERAG